MLKTLPCSPPAQEQPQPPQGRPGAPPFQPPSACAACRARGWSDHHHQAGQGDPRDEKDNFSLLVTLIWHIHIQQIRLLIFHLSP